MTRFSQIDQATEAVFRLLDGRSGAELSADPELAEVLRSHNRQFFDLARNVGEASFFVPWHSRSSPSEFVSAVFSFVRTHLEQTVPAIENPELRRAVVDSLRLALTQANLLRVFLARRVLEGHDLQDGLPEHLLDSTFRQLYSAGSQQQAEH